MYGTSEKFCPVVSKENDEGKDSPGLAARREKHGVRLVKGEWRESSFGVIRVWEEGGRVAGDGGGG